MDQAMPYLVSFGEDSWLLQWPRGIDRAINRSVHQAAHWISQHGPKDLELIPAYDSLMIRASSILQIRQTETYLQTLMQEGSLAQSAPTADQPSATITIPVCYDRELGNDLEAVARHTGLSAEEIIRLHTTGIYQVYMLGFLPGFAYMGEVDARMAVPRKPEPVPTRAGAVGLAGRQTGIYPLDSPGGWQIIGYTPVVIFDVNRQPPALLEPGMEVRFAPITREHYNQWKQS